MLEHLRHLWPEFRGAHVFITGAGGFVGSWLLETLLDADRALGVGVSVTALVRSPDAFASRLPHLAAAPQVTLQQGDVRSAPLPTTGITHFVHCASAATPWENTTRPDAVVELIEAGGRRMIRAAEQNAGVGFLNVGSGSVYGPGAASVDRVPESFPGEADARVAAERFGAAKRAVERRGEAAAERGVRFVSARGFGLVGPRLPLNGQFAIGNFLADARASRPVVIRGDGTPIRSWLHAADLAAWCWTILARGRAGAAYNVGSDEAVSIREAADRVASLAGKPNDVVCGRAPESHASLSRFVPDVTRAREELGLDARIPLDEALHRTWDWVRP